MGFRTETWAWIGPQTFGLPKPRYLWPERFFVKIDDRNPPCTLAGNKSMSVPPGCPSHSTSHINVAYRSAVQRIEPGRGGARRIRRWPTSEAEETWRTQTCGDSAVRETKKGKKIMTRALNPFIRLYSSAPAATIVTRAMKAHINLPSLQSQPCRRYPTIAEWVNETIMYATIEITMRKEQPEAKGATQHTVWKESMEQEDANGAAYASLTHPNFSMKGLTRVCGG